MKKVILFLLLPSMAFADRLGSLRSSADVLLTTQAVSGSGSGVVVPSTFTWGLVNLSTFTATNATITGAAGATPLTLSATSSGGLSSTFLAFPDGIGCDYSQLGGISVFTNGATSCGFSANPSDVSLDVGLNSLFLNGGLQIWGTPSHTVHFIKPLSSTTIVNQDTASTYSLAVGTGPAVGPYYALMVNQNQTVQITSNTILGAATYYANGVIKGASLSADQLTSTLAAGQFPALTGAVTNSAGSLATTEAKTLSNVNTFAASSITVAGASGLSVPNGVTTSSTVYASSAPITTDEYDNGNSSTAQTIDWTHGNMQKSTLTGNVTFTFRAPPHQATLTLRLLTGSGGFTAAWPGTVKWSGGTAPTITITASKSDFVICKYASDSSYYCSASGTQNF